MDQILHNMIEDAVTRDPDQGALDRVVAHMQKIDVQSLPLWQQAHTLGFLKKAVLFLAHENQHVDSETGIVDSEQYKDSIAQILRLQDATKYSGGMNRWLKQQQKEFAYALMRYPEFDTRQPYSEFFKWDNYSLEQRTEFAQRFIERMISFYFRDLPKPPIPPLLIFDDPHSQALFRAHADDDTGLIDHDQSRIFIRKSLMEKSNLFTVITSLVHEVTHLSSLFLGDLHARGLLKEDHPAYKDAEKRIIMEFNGAHSPGAIRDMYNLNSEEKMAFDQEDRFIETLFYQSPSLRLKFYRAGRDARAAFDKFAAALGPIINNLPRP